MDGQFYKKRAARAGLGHHRVLFKAKVPLEVSVTSIHTFTYKHTAELLYERGKTESIVDRD